jgi:hypothetical protein
MGCGQATMPFVERLKEKWDWLPTGRTLVGACGQCFHLMELVCPLTTRVPTYLFIYYFYVAV